MAFVDLQHDVTASDISLAHREGFRSVEHLKRYTTLGMATDQGKTSNVIGLALMWRERRPPIPQVGSTRFRPPSTPFPRSAERRVGNERVVTWKFWRLAVKRKKTQ